MSKKIVYIDMDQTIVDFHSHPTIKVNKDEYNSPKIYKPTYFRDLKPIPFALEAVRNLNESNSLEVFILTHGLSGSPICYSEKMEWIHNHLPEMKDRVIITCDKTLNKGDFLIDDDIKWNGFEGTFIEFTPYNLLKYRLDVELSSNIYKAMWTEVTKQIMKEL